MILLQIAALSIVGFAGLLFLPLEISGMVEQFGFTEAAAGRIASAHLFGIAAASIVLATRVQRVNLRVVCSAGVLLAGVANAVSALTPSTTILVVGRVLTGLGEGAVLAVVHVLVARSDSVDRRAALSSFVVIITGAILYPLLGPLFASHHAAAVFGLAALLAFVLGGTALTIRQMPMGEASEMRQEGNRRPAAPRRAGTTALIAIIFFYVGEGALWGYAARIGAGTGMSGEAISNTLAYAFLASLFGPVLAHLWKDRFGRVPPIIVSIAFLCVVALVLGFSREPANFIVATVVFYFMFVFAVVYSTALVAALDSTGRLAAAVPGVRTIGTALGPLVGSVALDVSGFGALGIVSLACYLVAILAFGSLHVTSRPV
jgi:predicted MFS family arabinose efflux permease